MHLNGSTYFLLDQESGHIYIYYRVPVLVILLLSTPNQFEYSTSFSFQMVRLVRSLDEVKEVFRDMSFDGQHVGSLLEDRRWFSSKI